MIIPAPALKFCDYESRYCDPNKMITYRTGALVNIQDRKCLATLSKTTTKSKVLHVLRVNWNVTKDAKQKLLMSKVDGKQYV